jgi:hypothetical protein
VSYPKRPGSKIDRLVYPLNPRGRYYTVNFADSRLVRKQVDQPSSAGLLTVEPLPHFILKLHIAHQWSIDNRQEKGFTIETPDNPVFSLIW